MNREDGSFSRTSKSDFEGDQDEEKDDYIFGSRNVCDDAGGRFSPRTECR
jgi:hypothetical protein